MDLNNIPLRDALIVLALIGGALVAAAVALLVLAARQIQQLEIPENADFFETLQAIPITVPIALDLLDAVFDVFSAPISWVILELLGLGQLKVITLVEGLIPGTQLIPTMTLAWVVARWTRSRRTPFREALRQHELNTRGQYPRLTRRSRGDLGSPRALPSGSRRARSLGGLSAIEDIDAEVDYLDDRPAARPRRRLSSGDYLEDDDFDGDSFPDDEPTGR